MTKAEDDAKLESNTVLLAETMGRDDNACECPTCGGFAEESGSPTKNEIKKYQTCGRSFACCVTTFTCRRCGQRIVAKLHAPDMD